MSARQKVASKDAMFGKSLVRLQVKVRRSLCTPFHRLLLKYDWAPDLDHQFSSLNNSAHLKLDLVPHTNWLQALFEEGAVRNMFFVVALLPDNGTLCFRHPPAPPGLQGSQSAESSDCDLDYTVSS